MRNYIFMLGAAFILFFASCGSTNSENKTTEADMKQEEQIADEVVQSSIEAKSDAEETEKEIDKLLEGI